MTRITDRSNLLVPSLMNTQSRQQKNLTVRILFPSSTKEFLQNTANDIFKKEEAVVRADDACEKVNAESDVRLISTPKQEHVGVLVEFSLSGLSIRLER